MKKIKYILPLLAMSFAAHAMNKTYEINNLELTEGQKNSVSKEITNIELLAAGAKVPVEGQGVIFVLKFTPEQFPASPDSATNTGFCITYNTDQIQTLKNIFQEGEAYKNMMTQNANQGAMMGTGYTYPGSGVEFTSILTRDEYQTEIEGVISFNSKLNGSQLKATFNAC